MNLQTLKQEKEKVQKEIIECSCKESCGKCTLNKATILALNLGIQAVENQIKDEIEFLEGQLYNFSHIKEVDMNSMLFEIRKNCHYKLNQLQKQKEDTTK